MVNFAIEYIPSSPRTEPSYTCYMQKKCADVNTSAKKEVAADVTVNERSFQTQACR